MGVPHVFPHRKRTAPVAPRSAYRLIRQGRAGEKDMRSYVQAALQVASYNQIRSIFAACFLSDTPI